jgi:hypothetical protein
VSHALIHFGKIMKFTCETGFICFDHVIELHKKPHTNKDIINLEF